MTQQSIQTDHRVSDFAKVAEEYCTLIESHQAVPYEEFIKRCAMAIGRLFAAGAALIDLHVSVPHRRIREKNRRWMQEYQEIRQGLRQPDQKERDVLHGLRDKFGKQNDLLWIVFDAFEESPPIRSTLSSNLFEIYQDIKHAQGDYGRTERHTRLAVWTWRFSYMNHWGRHCTWALPAINRLLDRIEEEAEDRHFDHLEELDRQEEERRKAVVDETCSTCKEPIMISYEEMPDDNADLAKIDIDFPRLEPDTAESCPCPMQDIIDYLQLEREATTAADLTFIRTAKVEKRKFWIWRFRDEDNEECYVTVDTKPNLCRCIGYDNNYYGLTPEQFILGTYHEVF